MTKDELEALTAKIKKDSAGQFGSSSVDIRKVLEAIGNDLEEAGVVSNHLEALRAALQ